MISHFDLPAVVLFNQKNIRNFVCKVAESGSLRFYFRLSISANKAYKEI